MELDRDRYQNMSQPRILTIQITMEERVERKVFLEGIAQSWFTEPLFYVQ
jgi:hypothetical protein